MIFPGYPKQVVLRRALAIKAVPASRERASRTGSHPGLTPDIPPEEWIARVENVTLDEMGEEAERLLDGRVLSLSVVGNVATAPMSEPDLKVAL